MNSRILWVAVIIVLAFSICVAAQTTPAATTPQATTPNIKHVPASYTDPTSGNGMYVAYCASCHGKDGKGDGPAAPAMKTPVTDLTILTVKNGGTFPAAHIASMIQGASMVPAHGSEDMPVWGPIFMSIAGHSQAQVQLRIRNLTNYVESMQAK
jgi:mono/diheme cytochrome c family protein